MDTPNLDFLHWTSEEVAEWIESKGFPRYKPCFTDNCITGRKLIFVDCVHMPRIGITDFKDMQAISTCVRELLGISQTLWSRSIADPPRDDMGLFLDMKSRTGVKTDQLTIQQLLDDICH